MKKLARFLAVSSLAVGSLNYLEIKTVKFLVFWLPKIIAGSLSPLLMVIGVIGAALGFLRRDRLTVIFGTLSMGLSARHVSRVIAAHGAFEHAFGPDWESRIVPERKHAMLQQRWSWPMPLSPEPRFTQDVAFWTIPDSDRQLLCDIWQPPVGTVPSGLAFIFLHGSGWHYADKDVGTRTLFRHLAAQGHVCMDVAYRLAPETRLMGMVGDVKRAIAWMKLHAEEYGVDPERVVVAGGSAGGHLALLAGYTPNHAELDPQDVDIDTSVRAVVSYYGPPDLRAFHTNGRMLIGNLSTSDGLFWRLTRKMWEQIGLTFNHDDLRGPVELVEGLCCGSPDEVPEVYTLGSPISHVGPHCPPTLLLQGEHDIGVKVDVVRQLYLKLLDAGVQAIYVAFPYTDHAFDLVLPKISPSAQASIYDLERFLALMV